MNSPSHWSPSKKESFFQLKLNERETNLALERDKLEKAYLRLKIQLDELEREKNHLFSQVKGYSGYTSVLSLDKKDFFVTSSEDLFEKTILEQKSFLHQKKQEIKQQMAFCVNDIATNDSSENSTLLEKIKVILKRIKAEIKPFDIEVQILEKKSRDHLRINDQKKQKHIVLTNNLKKMQEQFTSLKSAYDKSNNSKQQNRIEIEALQNSISQERKILQQNEETNKELTSNETKLKVQESSIENMKEQIVFAEKRNESLKQHIIGKREYINSLETKLPKEKFEDLTKENQKLIGAIDEFNRKKNEDENSLQNQRTIWNTKIEKLESNRREIIEKNSQILIALNKSGPSMKPKANANSNILAELKKKLLPDSHLRDLESSLQEEMKQVITLERQYNSKKSAIQMEEDDLVNEEETVQQTKEEIISEVNMTNLNIVASEKMFSMYQQRYAAEEERRQLLERQFEG